VVRGGHDRQLRLGEVQLIRRARLHERGQREGLDGAAQRDHDVRIADGPLDRTVRAHLHDMPSVAALRDGAAPLLDEDRRGDVGRPGRTAATVRPPAGRP